jgi:hypothetical protein
MTSIVDILRSGIAAGFVLGISAFAGPQLGFAEANSAPKRDIGAVALREYQGASARPDGSQQQHAIHFRDRVFALDTVTTGPNGATSLEFLDATRIDIGPVAEVRLDDFVYDPNNAVGAGEMSFAVGAFRYVGGRMKTEENIRLKTPTATMVIRGTELVIFVWPDGTTEVNVVSGAVEVSACTSSAASSGGSQLLMSGMRAIVLPTCVAKRTAMRALTERSVELGLPDREQENYPSDDDGDGGKGGRHGGGNEGGTGGNPSGGGSSGGTNNSGGKSSTHG